MRTLFTLLLLSLILFSCQTHHGPQPAPGTPKALQPEESSSFSKGYDRSHDLVSELYQEIAAKDTTLKELEKQISKLRGSDQDSLADFNSFDGRNMDYYNSALSHYRQISDSSIRQKMTALIKASQSEYDKRTLAFRSLISRIGQSKSSLNDLHELLMIVKTLPAIDKYQRENEPSSKPAEAFLQELEKLVQKMNGMTVAK